MLMLYVIDVLSSVSFLCLGASIFLVLFMGINSFEDKIIGESLIATLMILLFLYIVIPGHDTMHQMLIIHQESKEILE